MFVSTRCGHGYGLFGPAYACSRDRRVPDLLRQAIRHELDWFETHLPVPRWHVFQVKSCEVWRRVGICWFVDGAREMIAHAYAITGLLRHCVPVAKAATHRPGQILYRDAYQIVAKPGETTPTLWH